MPNLTIFSGINGSGKTTLFNFLNRFGYFDFGERVNPDEILTSNHGNWQSRHDVLSSGLIAKNLIQHYISTKTSFNWETTIITQSTYSVLTAAKANGFNITILFIGTNDCIECINRVNNRVINGGHGVNEEIIKYRYNYQYNNLEKVIKISDYFYLIDNSDKLRLVGAYKNGQPLAINKKIKWINDNLTI